MGARGLPQERTVLWTCTGQMPIRSPWSRQENPAQMKRETNSVFQSFSRGPALAAKHS